MTDWLPIATAPRDGSAVDLWDGKGRWTTARWDGSLWVRFSHMRGRVQVRYARSDDQFTHWMPLPAPPLPAPEGPPLDEGDETLDAAGVLSALEEAAQGREAGKQLSWRERRGLEP